MVRYSVRPKHSIGAKSIVIAHTVCMTEIATNRVPVYAFLIRDNETLVHPVPDATTLQLLVGLNHIPIVLHSAHTVAHRVAVFHHDKGTMIYAIKTLIHKALQVFRTGIHQADDIRVAVINGSLVGHGTRAIAFLQPVVGVFKIHTIAALVAHRPHNHRGVILVAFKHVAVALPHHFLVLRVFGEALFSITLGMGFAVGFVPNVKSIFVAEFVPIRIVGIMAGAHRIDIQLLHQGNVAYHRLAADDMARVRVMFMAVHTFY